MLLLILSISVVLGVSFLCSLTEACLLSLSMADIALLTEKKPKAAQILKRLKENVQKPIAVILIVNNFFNIFGAAISGAIFSHLFGNKWIGVFSFILSLAIIQWAEYLPKTLGVLYHRSLAGLIAWPLNYSVRLLGPLVFLLEQFNRPFQGRRSRKPSVDTLGEITMLTRFASSSNLLSREQMDIVLRSIKLSHARIQDIMVAHDEIKYLSSGMSMAEALIEAHIHHHTRYLLIEGANLDHVLGFVNVKDIVSALQINPSDPSLKGIARPVLMVKASQSVPALMKELTKGYQHMAVVQNEEGKTVGLVTLEDVVEAIVGDIEDEYDVLPTYVYRIADGRFLAGGGASLPSLKEKTDFVLPEGSACLHEWLCGLIPAAPVIEQQIPYQDLVFTIRKIRRSKIHEVIVDKKK